MQMNGSPIHSSSAKGTDPVRNVDIDVCRVLDDLDRICNIIRLENGCSWKEAVSCITVMILVCSGRGNGFAFEQAAEAFFGNDVWEDIRLDVRRWIALIGNTPDCANALAELAFSLADFPVKEYVEFLARSLSRDRGCRFETSTVVRRMAALANASHRDRICNLNCGNGLAFWFSEMPDCAGERDVIVESEPASVLISRALLMMRHGDPSCVRYDYGLKDSPALRQGMFDVVVAAPPHGRRVRVWPVDARMLGIDLPYAVEENWESAYLVRSLALLRPGGRAVVLMSEDFLCSEKYVDFRCDLLRVANVVAIVSFVRRTTLNWMACGGMCMILMERRGGADVRAERTCCAVVGCGERPGIGSDSAFEEVLESVRGRKTPANDSKVCFAASLPSVGSWSPRAMFADRWLMPFIRGRRVVHFGDVFKPLTLPRIGAPDTPPSYVSMTIDGVTKDAERLVLPSRSSFVQQYEVAQAGALLVTSRLYSLQAGVIPSVCKDLALRPDGQMYVSKEASYDSEMPFLAELIFSSRVYRSYLRRRYVRSHWREDVLNYLLPLPPEEEVGGILTAFRRERHEFDQVLKRMRTVSDMVTFEYVKDLGIRRVGAISRNFWSEKFASQPLSSVAHVDAFRRDFPEDRVLRDMREDGQQMDRDYLAGFLLCDFLPRQFSDVVWRRVSRSFTPMMLHHIGIPVPPLEDQRSLGRKVKSAIDEFGALVDRLQELRQRRECTALLERAVFG